MYKSYEIIIKYINAFKPITYDIEDDYRTLILFEGLTSCHKFSLQFYLQIVFRRHVGFSEG